MSRKPLLVALCLALALSGLSGTSTQAQADNADRVLTVMTRNMYLGTSFDEIFAAQSEGELVAEVAEAFADVQTGNPPARIGAIADEIAATHPDLVGLQEVALWQTGPFLDPAPADSTAYDFLQLLLDALEARGQHYAPVAVLKNFEAEAPAFYGPTLAFDVHYTQRDAVLARTDLPTSQLKVEGAEAHHYAVSLSFPNPFLGQLTIPRGWISADVKLRGKTYRFVSTHLESFSPIVQFLQADELLHTAADTTLPVLLAGDFNADATAGDATYQLLTGAGLQDAWALTHTGEPGNTWPLFLSDPFTYTTPTQRLDLILSRGAIEPLAAEVVGAANVTPSSPMPSDHAGVVASFRLNP